MYKLILLTLTSILLQHGINYVSPDGKFKLTVETREESDLQRRYITKLIDNATKDTMDIANCIRRDLSSPNHYWDKESRYLIFEQCDESFKDSRIKILNLKTKKVELELVGLIGNRDEQSQQFDSQNGILIYYDTSTDSQQKIPNLWTLDLRTKTKKKIFEFNTAIDMEFPEIKRMTKERKITLTYSDVVSGQSTLRQVAY